MSHSTDPYFRLREPPPTPEDEICHCRGTKPIKLMQALSSNPIHCIDCNLEVPPETIGFTQSLADEIADWSSVYDAIDRLWLDSGAYEDWAWEQLSDINSEVNRRGLALRGKLDPIRRCYYWFSQNESDDNFEPRTQCPECGAPLVRYDGGIFDQLICETSSIILSA